MVLVRAVERDFADVVKLANVAFRGTGPDAGWSTEEKLIEGERLTEPGLREELAAKPRAELLIVREDPEAGGESGLLLESVWLEAREDGAWYLGLLTVRPDMQKQQLGRRLLETAEGYARERGARRMRMTMIQLRETLIAWYERRGYRQTGETLPFPYGEPRFGRPLRDDLYFVVLEKVL